MLGEGEMGDSGDEVRGVLDGNERGRGGFGRQRESEGRGSKGTRERVAAAHREDWEERSGCLGS